MKKMMKKVYEAPVADVFEMQLPTVLMASGSGQISVGDDPTAPVGGDDPFGD